VATKQVNIDIIAKDKTRQAMKSATGGVDKLKQSVFNLKNALIGIGAGVTLKSFVDVGRQVESLQIRLKFLFGSVEEGAKAFDVMSKFASKVPFSLEQIQAGAGNLAVVAKDAEELSKVLEITGNVASVTGLDFQTTAEQIQRSLSAGIASADIFRERGVRDLLGFKAGATVTAEETAEAFERVFGKGGRFAGATDDLAETLTGTLSMLGDKLFNFQKAVAEQFLIGLKQEFGALDKALEDNEETINKVARAIGKGLSEAVIAVGKGFKFLKENFETIKAIGMGVVVFKITKAFIGLALAISRVRIAMIAFDRVSKTTIIGLILGLGVAIAETTGALERMFNMFKKDKGIEDFKAEIEVLKDQFQLFEHNGVKGFDAVKESFSDLEDEIKAKISNLERNIFKISNPLFQEKAKKDLQTLKDMLFGLRQSYLNVPLESFEVNLDKVTEKTKKQGKQVLSLKEALKGVDQAMNTALTFDLPKMDTDLFSNFTKGFKEVAESQKQMFTQMRDIGASTFDKLKTSLTDFVMTGKLSFKDLGTFVVRSVVEMLIGDAIKMAFAKSSSMFKMKAIKDAMVSLYGGAMKTFESIPFPLNIVAVGGALAFGSSLISKMKGFERGGRPPVGQPSIVGEKGAELFVPDQAGTVVPNDKLGMGKQVTVNFNINTVDARGFNELLVNSRGVIVNLINSAMNEKGKMAVV